MLSLTLVAALVAAAPTPTATLHLASAGLTTLNVDPKLGAFLSEHLASQLKLRGAEVVTQREIATLLGFERQKALLGCNQESPSCMAELASALGVDGILLGDVGRVGDKYLVNLKVIGSSGGKTVAVFSDSVGSEGALADSLTRGALVLATQAASALGRDLGAATVEARPSRLWAVLPLAVAVLAGGAGAWSFIDAQQKYTLLSGGGVKTLKEGQQLVSDGTLQQQLGVAGFGVAGGALIAAVVVWFALAPASVPDVVPGVSAGPGGAMAFSLGGHW